MAGLVRRGFVASLLAVLVGACTAGSAKPGGTGAVPSDAWAVPAVITVPYINRVLAKLNHIDGDALRSARAANGVTPEFTADEMAIYANEANYKLSVSVVQRSVANSWKDISPSPGDAVTTVRQLIRADRTCVYASVTEDLRPQGPGGVGVAPQWWIAVVPKERTAVNPTGWALIYNGYDSSGGAPKNACIGQ